MHRLRPTLFLIALLLGGAWVVDDAAATASLSPGLEARLAAAPRPVWLFLEDKGRHEADPAALGLAAERLGERTLARRAKVLPAHALVGWADLPLEPDYLAWLEERGFAIRAQSRWLNAVTVVAGFEDLGVLAAAPFVGRIEMVRPSPPKGVRVGASPASNFAPAPGSPWAVGGEREGAPLPIDYGGSLSELSQVNVPAVHDLGYDGSGVVIGMLDTGFKTTHEALVNVDVLGTWDFINDDAVVENEAGDDPAQHNHGTMTLSTVGGNLPGSLVGPAFGASFYLGKTEDRLQEQPIEEDWWAEGIEWLEGLGCDIVTSSLAYYDWYDQSDMDGNTAVTTIAGDFAVSLGVVVLNSAGNYRQNEWGTIAAPADGDSIVTVGAVEENGEIAGFSSPGPTADGRTKPDVCARGVSNHVADPEDDGNYLGASGTSFSCPLSAGVAALLLDSHPDATPMQIRAAMRGTASQADAPDNDYGWGILDALAGVDYLVATAAPDAPAAFALRGNWPNPFNPSTRIAFSLAEETSLRLAVFDPRGRLVTTLAEGTLPAGEHEARWDGRDAAGSPVASGVYFARLIAGDASAEHKLVLLK